MQEKEISAIHGCSKGKFLLSMDATKGSICYPWMQERVIFVIHGCRKKKFLLSMDAAKGTFCYPWMQQRELSAIYGCSKEKFLLSIDAGKGNREKYTTHMWLLQVLNSSSISSYSINVK